MTDLPVGQPLVGGPFWPGWDDTQNLQLELQSVVWRGRRETDAGHFLRGLDGEDTLTHQLWTKGRRQKDKS